MKKQILTAALSVTVSLSTISLPGEPVAAADVPQQRNCVGTHYPMPYTFADIRATMDKKFGKPNKNRVWQAENNDAVWDAWCAVTHSTALAELGDKPHLLTDKLITFPEDGSTAYFRFDSKSGGYTINLMNKSNGRRSEFKVHVKH
ncbi:hypothetical protein L1O03_00500 [Corynebacterium uropygiale]|uniref:Uncharacterized protein n=1 Tax=Corynebacterium uropygiale TaxID=1775911 RepID=A0A9X1QP78_9CORY|nr:hypothetical protein [Corynebacterium uropygiale]MCF4005665.1 hypothetical protein [Corynebacterium uropygiale]